VKRALLLELVAVLTVACSDPTPADAPQDAAIADAALDATTPLDTTLAPEDAPPDRVTSDITTPDIVPPDVASPDVTPPPDSATVSEWTLDPSRPLDTAAPPFASRTHPLAPTAWWATTTAPRPTNAFFENMVLGDGTARVGLYPHHVRALATGLAVAMPDSTVAARSVTTADAPEVVLRAAEPFTGHVVESHDLLSVTLRYRTAGGAMVTPLVRGTPYVTGIYTTATPFIAAAQGVALTAVNGAATTPVRGRRFELRFNNGRTWVVYTSEDLDFTWNASGLSAQRAFNGFVRVARAPLGTPTTVLDEHASVVAMGADLGLRVNAGVATVEFTFRTMGAGELLMMAMPHHLPRLRDRRETALTYRTLRGEMRGVLGARWTQDYPLSPIRWDAPRPVNAACRDALVAALERDRADDGPWPDDPYFFGKRAARAARLALIAESLGNTSVAAELRARVASRLAPWLGGRNTNALVYDTTWGGLVTSRGIADQGADFGQGYYNDHHFHYGYFLYAAAVIARRDPAWAASHRAALIALVRDIANPSSADVRFTPFRNMDWYEGHSWASGLFAFGDGRNQESTSEAVNAWYGMSLLGEALAHRDIDPLGRVLSAVELAGAQAYWQVRADSAVYPAPFRDHGVVGVLWSTKVDYATFFGGNDEYILGIQMLPFTPITEALLDRAWITDVLPQLDRVAAGAMIAPSWRGFLRMARAVATPAGACADVNALAAFDDGNSRTNALYWVATRP
jgi:endo-1,3(4)-beta-glucanase